jgi:hypothetical protein
VAYVSDESGRNEVWVQSFPPSEQRWQVSPAGGSRPRWRPDGRGLYFVSGEEQLIVVSVGGAREAFETREPRPLFAMREASDYAVGPDGGLLVQAAVRERDEGELQVVLNWASELRRR